VLIVGIGGTVSPTSSSDTALRIATDEASRIGADVAVFSGEFLKQLPIYDPTAPFRTPEAIELVQTIREASGIIISSASYHGSISGMLKNALDYTEDLALDSRVYFAGMPVGSIVAAKGWQGGVNTLATLRMIIHALRGWPTPYGCVINTAPDSAGVVPGVAAARDGICTVAAEVVHGARVFAHYAQSTALS
jgi:FMN reductase